MRELWDILKLAGVIVAIVANQESMKSDIRMFEYQLHCIQNFLHEKEGYSYPSAGVTKNTVSIK